MTRVLFTHRYSMQLMRRATAEGGYPRHHLWGADALEAAGHSVEYGPFGSGRHALTRLSWALGGRLGDVEQAAAIAARARGGDTVVYSGEATLVRGLALARRAGWPVRVVAIVHSAVAAWMTGLDVAVCLSSHLRDELVDVHGRDPATTPVAPWGPDLGYERYTATGSELIVSAGQTERDVDTLRRALEGTGLPARVYGSEDAGRHYNEVLEDIRRASVVAIPLARTDRLLGLSEIADALALAKPIVITRTPAIDFDPEAIGCGIAVARGDVAGWRAALTRLGAEPELAAAMGRRGREWAERHCNADLFRTAIVNAVGAAARRV
jgi:hypothetical protein